MVFSVSGALSGTVSGGNRSLTGAAWLGASVSPAANCLASPAAPISCTASLSLLFGVCSVHCAGPREPGEVPALEEPTRMVMAPGVFTPSSSCLAAPLKNGEASPGRLGSEKRLNPGGVGKAWLKETRSLSVLPPASWVLFLLVSR